MATNNLTWITNLQKSVSAFNNNKTDPTDKNLLSYILNNFKVVFTSKDDCVNVYIFTYTFSNYYPFHKFEIKDNNIVLYNLQPVRNKEITNKYVGFSSISLVEPFKTTELVKTNDSSVFIQAYTKDGEYTIIIKLLSPKNGISMTSELDLVFINSNTVNPKFLIKYNDDEIVIPISLV